MASSTKNVLALGSYNLFIVLSTKGMCPWKCPRRTRPVGVSCEEKGRVVVFLEDHQVFIQVRVP